VTAQAASSPSNSGATLNGTVTSDGGAPPLTDRGFYWSTCPPSLLRITSSRKAAPRSAAFSKPLSGLSANYGLLLPRAYAVNSVGTGLSSSYVIFNTLANTPSAPTV